MKYKEGDFAKVPSLKWLHDRNMEVKDKKKPIYVRVEYGYTQVYADNRIVNRYHVRTMNDIHYGTYSEDQLTPVTDEEVAMWIMKNA